jgi:phosphoserine phosphatase
LREDISELGDEIGEFGTDVAQAFEEVGAGAINMVGYAGGLLGADDFQKNVTEMTDRWVANNNQDKGLLASVMPSLSGALFTIGAGIVGGPGAAAAVGKLWFGTQVASSAGSAMREAEKYGATEGEMWLTGGLNAGAEYFTEKIPLKRLLGKVPVKSTGAAGKIDDAMLDAETKKLRKAIQKTTGIDWKEITATALEEGGTEALAGAAQTAIEMVYKNPEDYPTLTQYIDAVRDSFLGGALVGSATGGVQNAVQRRADDKRRKAAGKVTFAMGKDEKGNWVAGELLGEDEKGRTIMEVESKYIPVTEVGKGITMTYEQFKKAELDDMLAGTYSEGYSQNPELINGNTIALAGKAVNDAKAGVRAALNLSDDADVDAMIADKEFEGDAKEAVDKYIAEKARYEGMQDRLNEERENEIAEAEKEVDAVMHEDGNVYMTTLPSTGEAIFITGGKVVLDNEG